MQYLSNKSLHIVFVDLLLKRLLGDLKRKFFLSSIQLYVLDV